MSVLLVLAQVPPLNPDDGRQWIPNYSQIISALNGLALAGLLFAAGVVVVGGATWALAANRAPTQGPRGPGHGDRWVRRGDVIGAAAAIVNPGLRLGS